LLPETWLQILVVLGAVVPGFVYQGSRRRVSGPDPDEAEVTVRVLRAIATSAVFACLYVAVLGSWLTSEVASAEAVQRAPRRSAGVAGVLVFLLPWASARAVYFISTAAAWRGAVNRAVTRLRLRRAWNPTPSAWDYTFGDRPPCWVRVFTAEGQWIGGYFGFRSFASSYPEPRDLFIEEGHAMSPDGEILPQISAPDGVYVRCDDVRLIDFIPVAE